MRNCKLGNNVTIIEPCNLYGCIIDDNVLIGTFCEVQQGAKIGRNTRVQSHTFICEGVEIGQNCFIGHGVMFTNDLYPKSNNKDWICLKTVVGDSTSIGSGATLLPVKIGKNVTIGAGAVVTKDIPDAAIVVGNPARIIGYNDES
jgi:acetyltransferase-like isoleucine patch superfamily enzyme